MKLEAVAEILLWMVRLFRPDWTPEVKYSSWSMVEYDIVVEGKKFTVRIQENEDGPE